VGGVRGGAGGGGGSGGEGFGLDGFPRQGPANLPPLYPADALQARIEGRVLLRVKVTAEGRVEKLAVERSAGWPSLDQAALAAVRDWRFFPARRAGVPVAFEVIVPVRFSIRD
jgi:protein TonB